MNLTMAHWVPSIALASSLRTMEFCGTESRASMTPEIPGVEGVGLEGLHALLKSSKRLPVDCSHNACQHGF
jgi:hypothetical protein